METCRFLPRERLSGPQYIPWLPDCSQCKASPLPGDWFIMKSYAQILPWLTKLLSMLNTEGNVFIVSFSLKWALENSGTYFYRTLGHGFGGPNEFNWSLQSTPEKETAFCRMKLELRPVRPPAWELLIQRTNIPRYLKTIYLTNQ